MKRKTLAVGTTALLALGLAFSGAQTASAHTPEVTSTCEGLTVNLTNYATLAPVPAKTEKRLVSAAVEAKPAVTEKRLVSAAVEASPAEYKTEVVSEATPAVPAVYETVVVTPAVEAKPAVYETVTVKPAVPAQPAVYETVTIKPAVPAVTELAHTEFQYQKQVRGVYQTKVRGVWTNNGKTFDWQNYPGATQWSALNVEVLQAGSHGVVLSETGTTRQVTESFRYIKNGNLRKIVDRAAVPGAPAVTEQRLVKDAVAAVPAVTEQKLVTPAVEAVPAVTEQKLVSEAVPAKDAVTRQVLVKAAVEAKDAVYETVEITPAVEAKEAVYEVVEISPAVAGNETPNTVSVTINGEVVDKATFGKTFEKSYKFGDKYVANEYTVSVVGFDGQGTKDFTGKSTPCEKPVVVVPPTTVPPVTTPPVTTPPVTTPPVVAKPETCATLARVNIPKGDVAYTTALDGDNDGVACDSTPVTTKAAAVAPAPVAAKADSADALAFTGSDYKTGGIIAGILLTIGAGLTFLARRKTA